jgi:hypothetical protein
VPKKPVRVPAARTGRNVRWTLEVSAEGSKQAARAGKVARKRTTPVRAKQAADKKRPLPTAKQESAVAGPASRGPAYRPQRSHAAAPKTAVAAQSHEAPTAEPWRPRKSSTSHWPQVIAVGAAAAVVLAALAMTHDPGHNPSADLSAAPASQPSGDVADPLPATVPAARRDRSTPTRDAQPEPRSGGVALRAAESPRVVDAPTPPAESAGIAPISTAPVNVAPAPVTPLTAAPVATLAATGSPVSITGCLEASTDGDSFRLMDTDGADAPKSRGWRSGFLKKRPAPVALVAAPDPAGLRKLVGHRVTATGLLADREMRVRSFRSAGAPCD